MNSNSKIAINSVIIFVRLCVVTIVSVFASRMVLDALGASDFGLYNVIGGIVAVLNIVNASMTSTTYRYVAFELGKGRDGEPNKVFNSSFLIHAVFALCILVFGLIIGLWYVNNKLNVPIESLPDARFVLVISIVTASISTLFIPHQGLLVAYEKFSYIAIVDIFSQLFRLAAIYFLLYDSSNHIRTYSIIMMAFSLLHGGLFFCYCLKTYWRIVRFKLYYQWRTYKEMLSFAIWTLFGGVANIGKVQGAALIVNYFFGTVVNAAYAVGNQVAGFVQTFAGSLSTAAIPQITKNYSRGNMSRSMSLTSYISKYTFILMLLVAFPVLLDMDFLLSVWLTEVPEGSTIFCKLIVLDGLLGCLGAGIPSMVNAIGNIKVYQIVIYTFTILGLPIAFILYRYGGAPYYISAVFCIITLVACILKIVLLNKYYKIDVRPLFKISYLRMGLISIPLLVYYYFYDASNYSYVGHFVGLAFSELFLVIVLLLVGLEHREREMVRTGINNIVKKYFKK